MKTYQRVTALGLGFLFLIPGCSKDEEAVNTGNNGPCSGFKPPEVSNSGPASIGGNVTLMAVSSEPGVEYEWTGPAGFASGLQQPMLSGIQYQQNGVYRARISNASCTSSFQGTTVTVQAPCAVMAKNTAVVGGANWYFYSNVTCGPLGPNLYHGVTATSSYGVLYIQFNQSAAPSGYGVYGVSQLPGIDTTLVSMRVNEAGTEYHAVGGNLYVGSNGLVTTFIFCGITFQSAGSVSRVVTACLECS